MAGRSTVFQIVNLIENASDGLMRASCHLEKAIILMSSEASLEITEYDKGRLSSALSQFDGAAQYASLVFERWFDCPDEQETSTEPSQPSLTASGSIPNLRLHGIASFEPELLLGSSED